MIKDPSTITQVSAQTICRDQMLIKKVATKQEREFKENFHKFFVCFIRFLCQMISHTYILFHHPFYRYIDHGTSNSCY